jgi:hypothetical protein
MGIIDFIKQFLQFFGKQKSNRPNPLPGKNKEQQRNFVITLKCEHYPISKSYSFSLFENTAFYEENSRILFTGLMKISLKPWAYKSALKDLTEKIDKWLEQTGKPTKYEIIEDINKLNERLSYKEVRLYEIYFEAFAVNENGNLIIEGNDKCENGRYPIFEKAQLV